MVGLVITLAAVLASSRQKEGFDVPARSAPADAPPGLLDDWPFIGYNGVKDQGYAQIWRDYPVYPIGSYKQRTNNVRWPSKVDNGRAIRAEFDNAMYGDKPFESQIVRQLPPAGNSPPLLPTQVRVGYWWSSPSQVPRE